MLAPPDTSGAVDFATILRLTEAYRIMRYDTDERIRELVGSRYDRLDLVDLPKTGNRYMVGTLDSARKQEVWIRGTVNIRNALSDLQLARHRSVALGINLHAGFEHMAEAVHDDIVPRLRRDYDLVIFGHSLGAAEAVILSMLLHEEGYRVTRIYASGQPRLTDAAGAAKYGFLPILRIINDGDPVPFLPPRSVPSARDPSVHLGMALVLLDGPYYCLISEDRGNEVLASPFWNTLTAEGTFTPVKAHLTPAYIARLAPKTLSSIQVPFASHEAYAAPAAR